jgi:hypothetical protein
MRVLLAVVVLAGVARAEPDPALKLTHEPPPTHLKMRPRSATAPAKPVAKPIPMPVVPTVNALAPDTGEEATSLRDVRQPVSVQVNLGYVVDAAQPTGKPALGGNTPQPGSDYAQLRSYAFGEAYFSSRGIASDSLSTYFATRFQLAQQLREPQLVGTAYAQAMAPPIATWFDRSGVETWAGWLEVKDFLPPTWGLAPLRIRAGEFYVYGPWVMHMYGGLVGWDGKIVSITAYAGSRVPDYTLALATDRPTIAGVSAKVDLAGLSTPIPITLGVEGLVFTQSRFSDPSRHLQFEADWKPRKDITVIGQTRLLDGQPANDHFQVRSSYRQVTNFVLDVVYRHSHDWQWDPSFIVPDTDPTSARRYLDLGPILPQLTASLRGGTVVYDNIDLLIRGAFAADASDDNTDKSNYSPNYAEIGGALEVRLRRTIVLGASVLSRTLTRDDPTSNKIFDLPGTQILPATTSIGEKSFVEVGTSARMSLGARSFSAVVEAYGRRTHYAEDYCLQDPMMLAQCLPGDGVQHSDLRAGGRFTVDAWIGSRLRLFASYEISSALDFAPEITGYKSLKLMMEGRY